MNWRSSRRFAPQDDSFGELHSTNTVIPTERLKGETRNLQSVPRSQIKPESQTGDPHVRASALPQNDLFWRHQSINPVIPTEKPVGFDEESTVNNLLI